MTRTETRYGCFLSDLTGLARSPSIANLPPPYISLTGAGGKGGSASACLSGFRAGCHKSRGTSGRSRAPCRMRTIIGGRRSAL